VYNLYHSTNKTKQLCSKWNKRKQLQLQRERSIQHKHHPTLKPLTRIITKLNNRKIQQQQQQQQQQQ